MAGTEYVGKLFHKDDSTPLSVVFDALYYMQPIDSHFTASSAANHRGLNYNFTLNYTQVIDAVACGNNTRYINHGTGSTANCEARSLYPFHQSLL